MAMEIAHSKELGGLVPIEGWYALDDEGVAYGPFETEDEVRSFRARRLCAHDKYIGKCPYCGVKLPSVTERTQS